MKRFLLIVPLALVFFLVACGEGDDVNNITVPPAEATSGINVSGEGRVTVEPDVARLNLGVEVTEDRADLVLVNANGAMDNVMQVLTDAGVSEEDIQTTGLTVQPIYNFTIAFYSKTIDDIADLPQGATVAIPNDASNTGRALKMLADAKIITLAEGVDPYEATVDDIAENPKDLQFLELQINQLNTAYDEADLVFQWPSHIAALGLTPQDDGLLTELDERGPVIDSVLKSGENLRRAFVEAAQFGPAVDRFFTEIFVMVDDAALRKARLRLMKRLEQQILRIADISEIVSETE